MDKVILIAVLSLVSQSYGAYEASSPKVKAVKIVRRMSSSGSTMIPATASSDIGSASNNNQQKSTSDPQNYERQENYASGQSFEYSYSMAHDPSKITSASNQNHQHQHPGPTNRFGDFSGPDFAANFFGNDGFGPKHHQAASNQHSGPTSSPFHSGFMTSMSGPSSSNHNPFPSPFPSTQPTQSNGFHHEPSWFRQESQHQHHSNQDHNSHNHGNPNHNNHNHNYNNGYHHNPYQNPFSNQIHHGSNHHGSNHHGSNHHGSNQQGSHQQQRQHDVPYPLPSGFPDPKHDPRVQVKKEDIGQQNNAGKPWGTKMSYVYKDPKKPNAYMEVTEVKMSMNKDMSPHESASKSHDYFPKFGFNPPSPPSGPFFGGSLYGSASEGGEPNEPPEPNF